MRKQVSRVLPSLHPSIPWETCPRGSCWPRGHTWSRLHSWGNRDSQQIPFLKAVGGTGHTWRALCCPHITQGSLPVLAVTLPCFSPARCGLGWYWQTLTQSFPGSDLCAGGKVGKWTPPGRMCPGPGSLLFPQTSPSPRSLKLPKAACILPSELALPTRDRRGICGQ